MWVVEPVDCMEWGFVGVNERVSFDTLKQAREYMHDCVRNWRDTCEGWCRYRAYKVGGTPMQSCIDNTKIHYVTNGGGWCE